MYYSIVLPRHLNSPSLLVFSADGANQNVSGNILVQAGWVQFWGNNTKRQPIPVVFPKQFKTIPTVVCSFGGYGQPGDGWTDTPNSSWGGCVFSAVGVTNTSFTARCRRFDSVQLLGTYYVNWIAIGSV